MTSTNELQGTPAAASQEKDVDDITHDFDSVWQSLTSKPTAEDVSDAQTKDSMRLFDGQPLTSRSEILAWYLVDWANSPTFNVLLSLIIPLYLAQMATNCACSHGAENGCDIDRELIGSSDSLTVDIGLFSVNANSFTFTMISISGGIQFISYLFIGALADYSFYSFYLFRITAVIAAFVVGVWGFMADSKHYLFAGFWLSVQLVFFGLSIIFYNAILPKMVENHWFVRRAIRRNSDVDSVSKLKQQLTDDMSQYGQCLGYCGSLTMIIVTTMILFALTKTRYIEYDGYGVTSGDGIDSYDEMWLKEVCFAILCAFSCFHLLAYCSCRRFAVCYSVKVYRVDMSFGDDHLSKIQLFYSGLTVNGSIYGDDSANTTDSFMITDSSYITEIEFWINDNDGYLNGLRFTTQNGSTSSVFGGDSLNKSTAPDSTVKGDSADYILSGYTVYVSSDSDNDNSTISGMDILMMNQEVGQIPSNFSYRVVFLLVFVWWNVFQFIALKYLKRRDGPPLPEGSNPITFSMKSYYRSFKELKKYPNLFRYLLCWFMFSDALNTIFAGATLYGISELGMTGAEVAIALLQVMLVGAFGCWLGLWMQRKLGWSSKQMLLLYLTALTVYSLYAMLGLIPNSPIGYVSKSEFYIVGFFFALNFGSLQAFARSIFASIVPVGKESEMFALYEATDKGSSWMGPLVMGVIANFADLRWGFAYSALFFAATIPILWFTIDTDSAVVQAGRSTVDLLKKDKHEKQENVQMEVATPVSTVTPSSLDYRADHADRVDSGSDNDDI